MSQLKFVFRADKNNVGDWWCSPSKYFPFKPATTQDILSPSLHIDPSDVMIMGGGAIGSEFFRPYLQKIKNFQPKASILWGAGADAVLNTKKLINSPARDLYSNYFDFMDEVGIRVFSSPQKFKYVPCVSCMSNLFFQYRDVKPTSSIGVYNHKDVILMNAENPQGLSVSNNAGDDLEEKLKFLSSCEYIITNTYHGVYWATLLERKVVCIPFKSGLFSFKYPPTYCFDGKVNQDILNQAKSYKGVLEESRKINLEFYAYLAAKYDLV